MRVFVTRATGFIGRYLVPERTRAGHRALGLARSDALARAGAEAMCGDLANLVDLRAAPSGDKRSPAVAAGARFGGS